MDAPRVGDAGVREWASLAMLDAIDLAVELGMMSDDEGGDWDLPGGMCESNEPPPATARRELAEELGLNIAVRRLLCVQWVSPHGPWDDTLLFVFDGGVLSSQQVGSLKLVDDELAAYRFSTDDEAVSLLRPYV